jgi:cytochrome c-type biogenesis protein CcmH/NrfF
MRNKLSASGSQLIGKRAGKRGRSLLLVIAIAATLIGAGDSDPARFKALGHRMICPCGCNEVLLECNHVGCPDSDGMRNQLSAGISSGQSDDTILQSFVAKYGNTVLAAPTTKGFNRVAWIMPFLALGLGLAATVFFVQQWRKRAAPAPVVAPPQDMRSLQVDELRRRAREETAL